MKQYYVYILFSHSRTLYIGITSDLEHRLHQHRTKAFPGFTSKYNINQLAYYEIFGSSMPAIEREKQLKGWKREKKIALIESMNPHWDDLTNSLSDIPTSQLSS